MSYKATCNKCHRVFDKDSYGKPYTSQTAADKGVAMHDARSHTMAIVVPSGNRLKRREMVLAGAQGILANGGNGSSKVGRSQVSNDEREVIVDYIRSNRNDESRTRTEIFIAALKVANVTGKIQPSSSAVWRYYNLADDTSGVPRKAGRPPRAHGKSNLTQEEIDTVVNYIREHKGEYRSRTECLTAALDAAGVTGRIQPKSTAVVRYFQKAEEASGTPQKRKYTRRNSTALTVVEEESTQLVLSHRHGTLVKQCPRCGLVIDGAEDIFQLLQDSPEIVHLALAAARKMHARKLQQLTQ